MSRIKDAVDENLVEAALTQYMPEFGDGPPDIVEPIVEEVRNGNRG